MLFYDDSDFQRAGFWLSWSVYLFETMIYLIVWNALDMEIRAKYSLSDSISAFSFSQSGIFVKSICAKPHRWLGGLLLTGLLFVGSLLWILSVFTRNSSQLRHYSVARKYFGSMPMPKDKIMNTLWSPCNAVILVLCRNRDGDGMLKTLRNFEEKFNKKYGYPYVFLNNEEFDGDFKKRITNVINKLSGANVEFGQVSKEHWSYPEYIDQGKVIGTRLLGGSRGIYYGESESSQFMYRYLSGFFYLHPLLQRYEYYWRIEPGVELVCDVNYDVFQFMKSTGKKYGFIASMKEEISKTIPTLWDIVMREFLPRHPRGKGVIPRGLAHFDLSSYHTDCHFWGNFEISSLDFFRSSEYKRYFKVLDKTGGFFHEHWRDGIIHSIATRLFLKPSELYYFYDIGYKHEPHIIHCPSDFSLRKEANCICDPLDSVDISLNSCQIPWNIDFMF